MKDDPTQVERPASTARVPRPGEERTVSGDAVPSVDPAGAPTVVSGATAGAGEGSAALATDPAVEHRAVEARAVEHRVVEHRVVEHGAGEPGAVEQRAVEPRAVEHHVAGPNDALSAIFRFHGRIRAALFELDSLAVLLHPDDEQRARADKLMDFFTGPLVWHDIDEETSLMPRLRRRVQAEELETVLDRVSEQHEAMETTIEHLLPALRDFAEGRVGGAGLSDLAEQLHDVLEPHLSLEEHDLLPFARLVLTDEDLAAIATEVKSRHLSRDLRAPRAVPLD